MTCQDAFGSLMSGKWQPCFSSLSPLTRPLDCRTEVPGAETAVGGDGHGQADQAVVTGPKRPHGSQAVRWGGVGGGRQRAGKQEGAGWKEKPALASRTWGEPHPIVHGPRDPPDEGCAREAGQGPWRLPSQVFDLRARGILQQSSSHSPLLQPPDPDLSLCRLFGFFLCLSASLSASVGTLLSV